MMNQRQFVLLLVFLLPWAVSGYGQQAVLSGGGDISAVSGSVAYSIGQAAYIPAGGESGKVFPGVQQPNLTVMVATQDPQPGPAIKLFPNPAAQILYVELEDSWLHPGAETMRYQLTDMRGQGILEGKLTGTLTPVAVESLAGGVYAMRVFSGQRPVKSFIFSKTN